MKYVVQRLKRFCGYITGFVFFIGGLLKLVDPVGAGLVMDSYFDFLHLGFLSPAAKFFGVFFALVETVIGAGLITGVWRKVSGIIALSLQVFFTVLTALLVIFKPEMDCGCFGEAVEMTHMQTFLKNIVLLALLTAYVLPLKNLGKPKKKKYVSFGVVTLSVIAFTVYSCLYIPMVDFTDYKPGMQLQAVESETQRDAYEAVFIYEKDGARQEFDLDHLPDSTWTFVETHTKMREGVSERVPLSITDADGQYRDELAADGRVMALTVYDTDVKPAFWKKSAAELRLVEQYGFTPLLLIAPSSESIIPVLAEAGETDILKWVYFSDYKTIITLNRSNGGMTYLNDGTIIRKWARRVLPVESELKELSESDSFETEIDTVTSRSLSFQGFLLYVFAIMLLL